MTRQHGREEVAVDRWIERSLRERYASTLREPLPECLTKLLGPDPALDGRAKR